MLLAGAGPKSNEFYLGSPQVIFCGLDDLIPISDLYHQGTTMDTGGMYYPKSFLVYNPVCTMHN